MNTPKTVDNSTENIAPTSVSAEKTAHAASQVNKATKPLTRKQKAFVHHLVDNPKDTGVKAVQATYGSNGKQVGYDTAKAIASELLTKPHVLNELAKYSDTAERTLIDIMQYSAEYGRTKSGEKQQGSAYASVSARIADSLLDRLHGKATQHIQATSQSVNINVDLTA